MGREKEEMIWEKRRSAFRLSRKGRCLASLEEYEKNVCVLRERRNDLGEEKQRASLRCEN